MALRGVAGASKWFLSLRRLRNLAQGSRWLEDAGILAKRFRRWLARNGGVDNHCLSADLPCGWEVIRNVRLL